MIKKRPQAIPHMFMPGETIVAAIKKYNLYDATKEEVTLLLTIFNEYNSASNPRPGDKVLIPILERHSETVFNSLKTQ